MYYNIFTQLSDSVEAIKQGWSWPAFFFPIIWAMIKKLWGDAIGVFIGLLILAFIFSRLGIVEGGSLMIIALVLIRIDFLVNGNLWCEENLTARGFENVIRIAARSPKEAAKMYLKTKYLERLSDIIAEDY
jgi:hypothetical protein